MLSVKVNDKTYVSKCGDGHFLLILQDALMKTQNFTADVIYKINNMLKNEGIKLERLEEILTSKNAEAILAKYNLTKGDFDNNKEMDVDLKMYVIHKIFNIDLKIVREEMDFETMISLYTAINQKMIELFEKKKELLPPDTKNGGEIKAYSSNL